MSAQFAAFFKDINIFRGEFRLRAAAVVLLDEIGQMQGAAQPGWTGTYDQNIRLQLFALSGHAGNSIKQPFGKQTAVLSELLRFLQLFSERRDDFEDVGDYAVVGDFEDGCVLVFVYRHNGA